MSGQYQRITHVAQRTAQSGGEDKKDDEQGSFSDMINALYADVSKSLPQDQMKYMLTMDLILHEMKHRWDIIKPGMSELMIDREVSAHLTVAILGNLPKVGLISLLTYLTSAWISNNRIPEASEALGAVMGQVANIADEAAIKNLSDETVRDRLRAIYDNYSCIMGGARLPSIDEFNEKMTPVLEAIRAEAPPAVMAPSAEASVPSALVSAAETAGIRELREKTTAGALSAIDDRDAVVRIIVGIRQEDLNRMKDISRELSREMALKGFGILRSDAASGMTAYDRNQIVLYVLSDKAGETKNNYDRALEAAKAGLIGEMQEGKQGYIVSFAAEKADPENIIQKDEDRRLTTVFIRDGYSDYVPDGHNYPDLMARQTIARFVAYCLASEETGNSELVNSIFTEKLKPYLEKVSANDLAGAGNFHELLKKLNEELLKIRPINYDEMRDFRESQIATASSA